MKVFLAVASFDPSYGGPARSVSSLAVALAAAGHTIGVWAPDQSAATTTYLDKTANVLRLLGNERQALAQFENADLIHDNGIWLPHNHRLAKLAQTRKIPRVVSTRGMLEPWALNHKRWKKRLAWQLYQKRDMRAASALHATAAGEATQFKRLGLHAPNHVIPNGVDLPAPPEQNSKLKATERTALFVGRLYPVKGLPMLIDAWARVRPPAWKMQLVGPDEAGHRSQLDTMIRNAHLQNHFEFTGILQGEALQNAYNQADIFILPSHMESFGMAVGEALAHGLPVITTHGTPWNSLQTEGCGWWVPTSTDGIAAALKDATGRPPAELSRMGAQGRHWIEREFSWTHVASRMLKLYQSI